jgi:Peroxidase
MNNLTYLTHLRKKNVLQHWPKDNSDNAGLDDVIDGFETIYYSNGYDDIVTVADFYALATTVAITNAVQGPTSQNFLMLRRDKLECFHPGHELQNITGWLRLLAKRHSE